MLKITDKNISFCENYFRSLRSSIIANIENIELNFTKNAEKSPKFEIKPWSRNGGGAGEIGVIRGEVFEKMGVNFSSVFGDKESINGLDLPGFDKNSSFWASGVSLVAHPKNPFVPPIHMNVRCISTTEKNWIGGGIDLNPIYESEEESNWFHNELKKICDIHNPEYYTQFSKECDEYFFIKHRNKSRGIGGIFFDYIYIENEEDFDKNIKFLIDIGNSFNSIYTSIVNKKLNIPFNDENREFQLRKRSEYAEFNLVYDRGIKFGLATGGNPDAMMVSMPPLVKW